jgi:glutathione peroxidase
MTNLYDFSARTIDGEELSLAEFRGKALLVVNTASKCGFTPQYEGLEALYGELKDEGFEVLGFPCNQFGHQEPGDEEEIKSFCSLTYDVQFPMFAKVDVNGADAHPLYQWLKNEKKGVGPSRIKWNFTKFLVDAEGNVVDRYGPTTKPEKLKDDIRKAMGRRDA